MIDLNIYCDEYDFSPLAEAFSGEAEADCPLSAEIVFADRAEIRRLNFEFRKIDRETDVLSFPALDGILGKKLLKADHPFDSDEDGRLFLGSVVICTQVAAAQAEEYGHSYLRELNYLAAHGVCHLLGYDHMTDADRAAMREAEERVLKKLDLARE
ncbi:MAG: rRNA maturation RNase YbeY [Roseburia sp.]|nr:rRNA maturation RNase YbeY [Roseburia sp.]